ncbi:MAG: hypothetical protein ABJC74_13080, partial [Gemmatimonadota bacterium]
PPSMAPSTLATPPSLMDASPIPLPPAALSAARLLWADEKLDTASPEEVAAVIERVCAQLRLGLGRWIGSDGYRVLLQRTLAESGSSFPELHEFHCLVDGAGTDEILAAIVATGARRVRDAYAVQVAWLIHLLSQLIGEEMAHRLVEQAWMTAPSSPPAAPVSRSAS